MSRFIVDVARVRSSCRRIGFAALVALAAAAGALAAPREARLEADLRRAMDGPLPAAGVAVVVAQS